MNDKLIIVSENRLNQLVKMEHELLAAREVIVHFRESRDHWYECDIYQDNLPCDCGYYKDLEVLKKYDEAR